MLLDTIYASFAPIWAKKWQFLGVFMVVVMATYGVLFAIDFIPEKPEATTNDSATMETEEVPVVEAPRGDDRTPDRIIFDTLDKQVTVLNPSSASVATLDEALLKGVVRHPESADLLSDGTVFLFGHSSYLPNVINKNFQAFNGINKLVWGDTIRLQSSDFEYVYRVDRVYEVKASTAEVKIATAGKKLTLVTCNTFGAKEDRYVVEATLVDSYSI